MAADSDPYFALPKLYGAPAYARPPRIVSDSVRPYDPDDLPIAAEQTEEERAFAAVVLGPAGYRPQAGPPPLPGAPGADGSGANWSGAGLGGSSRAGRRFSLGALVGRRDGAPK